MQRGSALVAALVGLALLGPALPSAACSVPCGYVYPRLLFDLGERGTTYTLTEAAPVRLEGTLTFTWDITAEGLAVQDPTAPIVVTFDFPRKPDWLDVAVDPPQFEVPINPQYVQPTQTAAGPQLVYVFVAPLVVEASLNGTPVLHPEQPASLRILAQTSESGLYKPGFGVRDLPLDLPGAIVQQAPRGAGAELRIGAPEPVNLQPLQLEFEGATIGLDAAGALELWKPAPLTARVQRGGAPVRVVDMAASIVDERNAVLYTTGLRQRADGVLPFTFTFPEPGQYRVLVMARPIAGASEATFDPLVATFEVTLPGFDYDAVRYPDAYRAGYAEPVSEVHANTQELPRQYEKSILFPVLAGADSAAVQVQLGTDAGAALGLGSFYVEVLTPGGEQEAFGKLDPVTPNFDARLRGPLAAGNHRLHVYGTGANPLAVGGTVLTVDLGVFYPDQPVGTVEARGAPRLQPGGPIALGTGGIDLDLVLHDEPTLWAPLHAMLVAQDAAGRTALHPDFVLTVRGPPGAGDGGEVLYTTGLRHPHDGLLHWGFAPPAPGLYTISAYAAPTAEVSGAFWQPAIASWPLRVPAGPYPAAYRADYHDTTSTIRTDGYGGGSPFDKRYPLPILAGAREVRAELALLTNAFADHVAGSGPAVLGLELLDPQGAVVASAGPSARAAALRATDLAAAGTYLVRVFGTAYAPIDYSGAMYDLNVTAVYDAPPVAPGAAPADGPLPPRGVPGPEPLLLIGLALFVAVVSGRRR